MCNLYPKVRLLLSLPNCYSLGRKVPRTLGCMFYRIPQDEYVFLRLGLTTIDALGYEVSAAEDRSQEAFRFWAWQNQQPHPGHLVLTLRNESKTLWGRKWGCENEKEVPPLFT